MLKKEITVERSVAINAHKRDAAKSLKKTVNNKDFQF
jgi:hypothetical protein